jgi:hypothetical protein
MRQYLVKQKQEALNLANTVRKVLGKPKLKELPLGIPGDCEECSLARAIGEGAQVFPNAVSMDNPVKVWFISKALGYEPDVNDPLWEGFELPQSVSKFVVNFDTEKFPELVEPDGADSEF